MLSPAQLGIDINREETLDAVFQLGRQGTLWERIQSWWCAWRQGYEVSIALLVDAAST
ncbi:MAG: peptidoglycan binding domain-containing protein [bacterium]